MAEIYVAAVHSDTSKLSSKIIHDGLNSLVKGQILIGETMMKAYIAASIKRPETSKGTMASKVGHTGPDDLDGEITAAIGIPEIHKADESSPYSGKYPLFQEKGSGPFGPKESLFMKIPLSRGMPGYIKESKGYEGKHYLLATFLTMVANMEPEGEAMKADWTAKMQPDKLE